MGKVGKTVGSIANTGASLLGGGTPLGMGLGLAGGLLAGGGLGGGVQSGTSGEVAGAAQNFGNMFAGMGGGSFADLMSRISNGLGRNATASWMNSLGYDPSTLGLGGVASDLLRDPRDMTSGLFASMVPFEQQQTEDQIAGLRGSMGSLGGRFSRNLLDAEGDARAQLAAEFGRNREQALLGANQQRMGAFLGIQELMNNAAQGGRAADLQALQSILGFTQPGPPVHSPGLLPSLISAGGTIAGAALMNRGRPSGVASSSGGGSPGLPTRTPTHTNPAGSGFNPSLLTYGRN